MSHNLKPIEIEQVEDVLTQIETAFFDIPFENSDYQNKAFVMAAQQTPARAYRSIGLRMFAKIRAVKEYKLQQARNQIDREEKEAMIADPGTNEFNRRRLRLDILQLDDGKEWGEKLLNDALRELNCLYAEFVKFPPYTREQFEAEEVEHFDARLVRQLEAPGPRESILNMRKDLPTLDVRLDGLKQLK